MNDLEKEIQRLRWKDELKQLEKTNDAILENETYEENLLRRAKVELRRRTLIFSLYNW